MVEGSTVAATSSGFTYYDDGSALVRDESFGHYEIVSNDPFAVQYMVADGVTWSDGVPIDAADLLLAWAASSGHRSPTPWRRERDAKVVPAAASR